MKTTLKRRMTFDEMAAHMKLHSFKIPSKVSVGRYARELGYKVYKPMTGGQILFFYVNESIPQKDEN